MISDIDPKDIIRLRVKELPRRKSSGKTSKEMTVHLKEEKKKKIVPEKNSGKENFKSKQCKKSKSHKLEKA